MALNSVGLTQDHFDPSVKTLLYFAPFFANPDEVLCFFVYDSYRGVIRLRGRDDASREFCMPVR